MSISRNRRVLLTLGGRNQQCFAERNLDRLGYTQVFDYKAGKADWEKADLPVETS